MASITPTARALPALGETEPFRMTSAKNKPLGQARDDLRFVGQQNIGDGRIRVGFRFVLRGYVRRKLCLRCRRGRCALSGLQIDRSPTS
jgi:hypothetical protein